jgi:AcrR family transcriptional regulator
MKRAAELFQERGFHATGIDDIGEAAGVSGPAIYRHFKSKDAILLAILDQALDDLAEVIDRARIEGDDPATQLERFVRTQAGFAIKSPHVVDLLANERNHLPLPDRSRIVRKQRLNRAEWMHVISEARPDLLDPGVRLRLYGIVGLFRDMVTAPVREIDREELVDVMARMVLAAVYA